MKNGILTYKHDDQGHESRIHVSINATSDFIWSRTLDRNWSNLEAVEAINNKVSGTLVFRGTRVPVAALFENLRDGATVDQFLEWFPGVTKADVESVLNHEVSLLTNSDAA